MAVRGGTARGAMTYLAERVGHHDKPHDWSPPRRATPPRTVPPAGCRDPEGLDRYVDDCARRLWRPEGQGLCRWLTETRGLPPDVLAENRVGVDLGPRTQPRPNGMPRAAGIVLPVIEDGHAVYAQLRVPHPGPDRTRYLNPTTDLATNPRINSARPAQTRHPEVIVTEGTIDALTAAAAGYRAVAVLSATSGDNAVAVALAKLPHPLVLAFDADDAGRAGADRLASLLDAHHHPPTIVNLGSGDLNDAMRQSTDWPKHLAHTIGHAAATSTTSMGAAVSR